jgi:phage-related protein
MSAKKIVFYRTESGKCPVEEHLDSLTDEQAAKIAWVLKLIRELDQVPVNFFKKLANTNNIWEVRVNIGSNSFRLLGFFAGQNIFMLTNSFMKKSPKTPKQEIRLATKRRQEYLSRSKKDGRP